MKLAMWKKYGWYHSRMIFLNSYLASVLLRGGLLAPVLQHTDPTSRGRWKLTVKAGMWSKKEGKPFRIETDNKPSVTNSSFTDGYDVCHVDLVSVSLPQFLLKGKDGGLGVWLGGEHLPSMQEALGSIPSSAKIKRNRKTRLKPIDPPQQSLRNRLSRQPPAPLLSS